jgi:hypothetical protein
VDDGVDNVCRHAGHVVRTLGTDLWKRLSPPQADPIEQGKRDPPDVWKKNLAEDYHSAIHNFYPQENVN